MKLHNEEEKILKYISLLPHELTNIIFSYIPKKVTMFLTKDIYIKEHFFIRNYINKNLIEDYIRTMIRQDNHFVIRQLLVENFIRWISMKNYYYKNCIYANYILFLKSYAMDNESYKCTKIIMKLCEEQGLSKNQHKKNVIKYIRWKK